MMMKQWQIHLCIMLAIIIPTAFWCGYVTYSTLLSIPPDFRMGAELKALPIILIGCALVSILLMKRSNKNPVKR